MLGKEAIKTGYVPAAAKGCRGCNNAPCSALAESVVEQVVDTRVHRHVSVAGVESTRMVNRFVVGLTSFSHFVAVMEVSEAGEYQGRDRHRV